MIIEPSKTAEEIERRLSTLNDPELAELLRTLGPGLLSGDAETSEEPESYTSPDAPYWKKRIGFSVLAGLLAMSTGFAYTVATSHSNVRAPHAAIAAAAVSHHQKPAAHHRAPLHHRAPAPRAHAAIAPVHAIAAAPDEPQIRQARAQLLHEYALAAQARAQAARAEQQAKFALQQRADAQAWARAEALAQARAEARAEALEKAQAQDAQARERAEEQAVQNAQDPSIKPGESTPPSGTGRISTYPIPGAPIPMPGPIDTNCTPHRGSLFGSVLDHVRVGGVPVGGLLRLVGQ